MSRVAKAPVVLPSDVELNVQDDYVTVKGPKGTLNQHFNKQVKIRIDESDGRHAIFSPVVDEPQAWAHAGTARALVNNMVKGVTTGFEVTLELLGVGYRAQVKGDMITLSLGFSHNIDHKLPSGISAETPNNTTIVLKGAGKQHVGQAAAKIRGYRPPEPYKGKGVKYAGEVIVRKEAKKK